MKVDVVKLGKQTLSHTKHVILLKCRYHEQAKHQKAFWRLSPWQDALFLHEHTSTIRMWTMVLISAFSTRILQGYYKANGQGTPKQLNVQPYFSNLPYTLSRSLYAIIEFVTMSTAHTNYPHHTN